MSTPCERSRHSNSFNTPLDVFGCIVVEADGTCERRMVIRSVTLYSLIFLIRKVLTVYTVQDRCSGDKCWCASRTKVERWLKVELDSRWEPRACSLEFLNWVNNFCS